MNKKHVKAFRERVLRLITKDEDEYHEPEILSDSHGNVQVSRDIYNTTDVSRPVYQIWQHTKTLAAGTNTDTIQPSGYPIQIYWVAMQNPDAADREISIYVRNEADTAQFAIASYLQLGDKFHDRHTINTGDYLFIEFKKLILPANWDILVAWYAMTGGNNATWELCWEYLPYAIMGYNST